MVGDYDQLVRRQQAATFDPATLFQETSSFNYEGYQRLSTIEQELARYQRENPQLVKLHTFGTTHERRELTLIEINQNNRLPSVFIECGIHAR